jgi:hypothetical protein
LKSEGFKTKHKTSDGAFSRGSSKNSKGLTFENTLNIQLTGLDNSYQAELADFFNQDLQKNPSEIPSASAFYQARMKMKHTAFVDLDENLINNHYNSSTIKDWNGHRALAVDGSSLHVPDTLENVLYFGGVKAKNGDGTCPKARISFAYDPLNKLIVDAKISPCSTGERALAEMHLERSAPKDLFLYDRGYFSFWLLQLHEQKELSYCFRVPTKVCSVLCKDLLEGTRDQIIIDYEGSPQGKSECEKYGLPTTSIKIRLVKVVLDSGEVEVLATNLFSRDHSALDFKGLYHLRWGVEEEFKRLKCRIEIEAFSGVRTECVLQDFYADVLRLNISSLLAAKARTLLEKTGKKDKHVHAPNMSLVLSKLSLFLGTLIGGTLEKVENFLENITALLFRFSLPIREGRSYPQEKKPDRSGHSTAYKRST